MINSNRVVPVNKTDLISLYGLILKQSSSNSSLASVASGDVDGDYEITAAATPLIADQPVKSVDFASGVSSATLYFVADPNYVGFSLAGTATETAGAEVEADGCTLYSATLSSGTVTIAKVGF